MDRSLTGTVRVGARVGVGVELIVGVDKGVLVGVIIGVDTVLLQAVSRKANVTKMKTVLFMFTLSLRSYYTN